MVRADIIVVFALFDRLPVTKSVRRSTSLEDPNKATEKFGPLKVVLGAISAFYANREVSQQHPQGSPLTDAFQGTVAVGNRIEVLLSHVVVLEESLSSRPGDVAEQRRRNALIQYVISPPSNSDLSIF